MRLQRVIVVAAVCMLADAAAAQITLTRGSNMSVDAAADGRIAMDLRGHIWVLPGGGGDADLLAPELHSAQRPRWSPDDQFVAAQAVRDGTQGIYTIAAESGKFRLVSEPARLDIHPSWHPDGLRIVYASATNGDGFDLWEVDLPTELRWRISARPGDEIEPAWSADGRHLVYVHEHNQTWSLVLRRRGQPEEVLVRTNEKIASPSWRPDGSLIMFYQGQGKAVTMKMVILSQPRLIREFANHESFAATPVSWLDRQKLLYVADGQIRRRSFGAWRSRPLPFRAVIEAPAPPLRQRERVALQWIDEPEGELIIRSARLFDGIVSGYRDNHDIVIRGGRIAAIEPRQDRGSAIVIDMGDLTVLPGYIDADARLPAKLRASHGPDLLTTGVTTVVSRRDDDSGLNKLWSGKEVPGPRLLTAPNWQIDPPPPLELDITAAISTSRSAGRSSGTALPLQFRTLRQAGLSPEQSLRSVGVNAAAAMLADPYLGRIAVGAAADLVLVAGDPLNDLGDAMNIVAVVRNGRFFSVSGLIDRAKSAETVE